MQEAPELEVQEAAGLLQEEIDKIVEGLVEQIGKGELTTRNQALNYVLDYAKVSPYAIEQGRICDLLAYSRAGANHIRAAAAFALGLEIAEKLVGQSAFASLPETYQGLGG